MKILNIESITSEVARTITLKGVSHPVIEMTVENFVDTTKHAERLEKENASIVEQIEATAESILRSVPTLDRKEIYAMSLKQLGVIYRFISGEDEFEDFPDAISDEKGEEKK